MKQRRSLVREVLVVALAALALQAQAEAEKKPLEDIHEHTGDDPDPLIELNDIQSIVGGKPTSAMKFPWQVLVWTEKVDGNTYQCGGSIISLTWIMSAAHCFADDVIPEGFTVTATRIYLYAGATDVRKRNTDPNVQLNVINKVDFKNQLFIYPNYNKGAVGNNDIALIKLKKSLTQTKSVQPIALATAADFKPRKKLTASGWGFITPTGPNANILQYIDGLNLISQEDCVNAWSKKPDTLVIKTDRMFCQKTRNKNTCDGDSGSPVITGRGWSDGPPYVQIGISSAGSESCGDKPDVFTKVDYFTRWIKNIMSGGPFQCTSDGLFPNRDNCRKFFVCTALGGGRYRMHTMTCASNLYFNPGISVCDYAHNVVTC